MARKAELLNDPYNFPATPERRGPAWLGPGSAHAALTTLRMAL